MVPKCNVLFVLLLVQAVAYATLTFENKLDKPVLMRFETGQTVGQVSYNPQGMVFDKVEISTSRPALQAMERNVKSNGTIVVPNFASPEKMFIDGMHFDPRGHAYGATCTITIGPKIPGSSLFEVSCEDMPLETTTKIEQASLVPLITEKEIYERLELQNVDDPKPYEILKVKEGATKEEIEKAYKELAEQWDPKKKQDDEKAVVTKILKRIKEAYEELVQP